MKKSLSILFLSSTMLLTSCFEGYFSNSSNSVNNNSTTNNTTQLLDVSIDILNENTTLTVGDTLQLEVETDDGKEHNYIYESMDEDIITISDTGLVTAISAGHVTLYVSLKEEEDISTSINFTVNEKKEDKGNSDEIDDDTDSEYQLVFHDEFDGDSLNENYWSYQYGNGSQYGVYDWGNSEAQSYKKENVTVKDGKLIITAKKESDNGKSYTSGRIRTYQKVAFTYGKIEARMKLPAYSGLWPAFWLLPNTNTYGYWPNSGEIDIMEARGRVDNEVSAAVHMADKTYNQHFYQTNKYVLSDGDTISNYHTYTLIWEKNDLTFLVDDNIFMHLKQKSLTNYEGSDGQPFDTDFYILFNLAVGGSFDSYTMPNDNDLPASLEVDYVRWYQKKNND